MNTKPLYIVKTVIQRMHFKFAAIAGAGINHSDRQASPENSGYLSLAGRAELHRGLVVWSEFLCQTPCFEDFTKNSEHIFHLEVQRVKIKFSKNNKLSAPMLLGALVAKHNTHPLPEVTDHDRNMIR